MDEKIISVDEKRNVIHTPFGTITRRDFVKAGAAAAATAAAGSMLASCSSGGEGGAGGDAAGGEEGVWLPTQCNGCFNACSILGRVVDGKLVEIKGDDRSPAGWGHLCGKGMAGIMQLYDPNRITVPLKRTNPEKGVGIDPQWEEISWDEAYDTIIEHLDEQAENGDPVVVFALITSIISWIDSMNFLGSTGNIPMALKADICGAPTHSISALMTGSGNALPDYTNIKYLIQWGTQAGTATRHGTSIDAKFFAESRANGCKLVSVDPHCSGSGEKADEWIPIRPGTDAAMALAMSNELVNNLGIYDAEFLTNRTNAPSLIDPKTGRILRGDENKALYWDNATSSAVPYDQVQDAALEGEFDVDGKKCKTAFSVYKEHIAKYTCEYAEEITTVPAETIARIAKEFGEAACIGETVEVDGLTVPYRPAAVDIFSGISRHKHGFLSNWAILQLNTLIGATFSVGGYLGYYTANKYGYYEGDKDHSWELTTWPEDGTIEQLKMAHGWPDRESYPEHIRNADFHPIDQCMEALQPLGMDQHFAYIAQLQPEVYNTKPAKMAFCMASNPLKNWCNHEYQAKLLASFDWIFGMDIYLNDSSYFYDLIIPEPSYMERYDPMALSFNNHRVPGLKEVPYITAARMPIVDAIDGCPSALDSFGEMAERRGKTAEFSGALNDYYHIAPEYALDGKEKVTAERVVDAALKSMAGGKGIEWFRENGVLTRERTAEEVYAFAGGLEGRIWFYFDFMFEAKEKIEAVVEELGIEWETCDYIPLPEYMKCCDFEIEHEGYEYYPVYWTNAINTDTWQVENAWINEINEMDETYLLELNTATGEKLGIASGDKIRVSNHDGDFIEGIAVLTEFTHPEVIASVGGHLNMSSNFMPVGKGKGTAINHLVPAGDPKRMEYIGSGVDQCVRCKIEKIS